MASSELIESSLPLSGVDLRAWRSYPVCGDVSFLIGIFGVSARPSTHWPFPNYSSLAHKHVAQRSSQNGEIKESLRPFGTRAQQRERTRLGENVIKTHVRSLARAHAHACCLWLSSRQCVCARSH